MTIHKKSCMTVNKPSKGECMHLDAIQSHEPCRTLKSEIRHEVDFRKKRATGFKMNQTLLPRLGECRAPFVFKHVSDRTHKGGKDVSNRTKLVQWFRHLPKDDGYSDLRSMRIGGLNHQGVADRYIIYNL